MPAAPKHNPSVDSTAGRVLAFLSVTPGAYVSGGAMSEALGLSRVAIWKQVRALRAQGCRIDAAPRRGYRLTAPPDMPTAAAVGASLHTRVLGRALLFVPETESTNRLLRQRAAAGAAEGLTVVADRQTGGRGRMGRTWFSPAGVNLYVSILLRPAVGLECIPTLPLLIGAVTARVLERAAPGLVVDIKWPNDLHAGGRKLGGILCEMAAETDGVSHVVVGIGLNVNLRREDLPRALAARATSLARETGRSFSRAMLLAALLDALEADYATWCAQGLAPFLAQLAARDALRGKPVRIEQAGRTVTGLAHGIQADGTLALLQADGTRLAICSGDAHLATSPTRAPAEGRCGPREWRRA